MARPLRHPTRDHGVCRQRPGDHATRARAASPGWWRRSARPSGPGRRFAACSKEAGVAAGAVEAVFTGPGTPAWKADKVQRYQRSLTIADALDEERAARLGDEWRAPAAAARRSAASGGAGLVRDGERQMAEPIEAVAEPFQAIKWSVPTVTRSPPTTRERWST